MSFIIVLTRKYKSTISEIEDIKNTLNQIGNELKWFDWMDSLGKQIQERRDIPDIMKKELLRSILENIIVDYDNEEKVHRLVINFKIPVIFMDEDRPKGGSNEVVIKPPKSGRKPKNQNEPFRDYSTVTDSFPTTPDKSNGSKGFKLRFSLHIVYSNLWIPPYSPYQQELFNIISKFHDEDGWNFKMISDWLRDNNYVTPRGHTFTQKHTWSIYQKKNRSIKRFSRQFEDTITDMSIDVVDYIPVPKE
jgi:hypothetical protein